MIQSPGRYAPDRHADNAKVRRNTVLEAMLRDGAITSEEAAPPRASRVRSLRCRAQRCGRAATSLTMSSRVAEALAACSFETSAGPARLHDD